MNTTYCSQGFLNTLYCIISHLVSLKLTMPMDIVAVINYKGAVGKTTVTANLAGELANRGRKVLLLDTDPQASLTFSFVPPTKGTLTIRAEKRSKLGLTLLVGGIFCDDALCKALKQNAPKCFNNS
jgi:hypothetical protein